MTRKKSNCISRWFWWELKWIGCISTRFSNTLNQRLKARQSDAGMCGCLVCTLLARIEAIRLKLMRRRLAIWESLHTPTITRNTDVKLYIHLIARKNRSRHRSNTRKPEWVHEYTLNGVCWVWTVRHVQPNPERSVCDGRIFLVRLL